MMKDPSRYDWFKLQENETVIFWEHPSLIPPMASILFGIFLVLAGTYFAIMYNNEIIYLAPAVIAIILGVLISVGEYLRRITTHYIITDKKVLKKEGILKKNPDEFDFDDLENIDPIQGKDGALNAIVERVFGFGDFKISTSSERIWFENVPSWGEYHDELSKQNSMNSIREIMAKHADETVGEQLAKNQEDEEPSS